MNNLFKIIIAKKKKLPDLAASLLKNKQTNQPQTPLLHLLCEAVTRHVLIRK